MKTKLTIIFCLCCLFSTKISAQDEAVRESPVTFEAVYTGDFVRNFAGGIKKGSAYLGLANLKLSFDTEKAGLWKGGQFFINAANAHGGDPSTTLIGDFHTVSNIEADEMTYIHEFWFKQTFNHFELIAGLQDLNTDFVSSEYGGMFINSTFGTPSTIADNVPSPIFPFTTVGLSLKWNIDQNNTWKIALFDGLPTELENNPYNLKWDFDKNEGVFAVTEYQLSKQSKDGLKSSYRAGIYYHSQLYEGATEDIQTEQFRYNYGFYLIADQMIYQKPDGGGLGVFAQISLSPRAINSHCRYIGAGLSYEGMFRNRTEDKLGFAVTNAGFSSSIKKDETIVEICYKAQLTENIFIQPDFQYVINPEGTGQNLENAMVGFVRFGLNF
jgi:porin